MVWPPQTPELKHHGMMLSIWNLWLHEETENTQDAWNSTQNTLKIPRRCAAVWKAQGGHTNYWNDFSELCMKFSDK